MTDQIINEDFDHIGTAPQLGECLRSLRGRRTQQNVADHAKRANLYLHRPDVSTIERGRRLPTENELRGFLQACERTELFEPLNAVRLRLQEDRSNQPLRSDDPERQVGATPLFDQSVRPTASSTVVRDRRRSTVLVALGSALATLIILLLLDRATSTPPPAAPEAAAGEMPTSDCPTCFPGGKTFTEQALSVHPKITFRDPRTFKGKGPSVMPGQQIEVVCRFHDHSQTGWWYLIDTPPWNQQYYSLANFYRNEDSPDQPPGEPGRQVDLRVPIC